MNIKEVVGIGERRKGRSKKSGDDYDFTAIYCIYEDTRVKGHIAEEIMFSHLSGIEFADIAVGDKIKVFYDKRGYIQHMEKVEKQSQSNNANDSKGSLPKI